MKQKSVSASVPVECPMCIVFKDNVRVRDRCTYNNIINIHCIIVLLYYVVHESKNIRFQASDAAARAKNKRSTPIDFFFKTIAARKLRVKMHRQLEIVCEGNVHL